MAFNNCTIDSDILKAVDRKVFKTVDDELTSDVKYLYSTGCANLDVIMGGGGYASGRLYEIYGFEGSSKTALALELTKAFTNYWKEKKEKYVVLWLESEEVFNKPRAHMFGCDVGKYLIVPIDTLEGGFNKIVEMTKIAKEKKIKLCIIWDTIGSCQTENEKKDDEYADGRQYAPKLVKQRLKKIVPMISEIDAPLILVNQAYEGQKQAGKFIITFPVAPFGKSIKFYASGRLEMSKGTPYEILLPDGSNQKVGQFPKVKTVKNKIVEEDMSISLLMIGSSGIDRFQTVYNFLKGKKIIETAGSYKRIEFGGEKYQWQNDKQLNEIIEVKQPKLREYFDYLVYKHYSYVSPLLKIQIIKKLWEFEENLFGKRESTLTEAEIETAKLKYADIEKEHKKLEPKKKGKKDGNA